MLSTVSHLLRIETLIVLGRRPLDSVVLRLVGLEYYLARLVAASGPSCHLAQQLKCPLARLEVWDVQTNVRQRDAHQRYAWEVQPLRYHLRADEYVSVSVSECGQRRLVLSRIARRVAVPSQYPRARKEPLRFLRHRLRAYAVET